MTPTGGRSSALSVNVETMSAVGRAPAIRGYGRRNARRRWPRTGVSHVSGQNAALVMKKEAVPISRAR